MTNTFTPRWFRIFAAALAVVAPAVAARAQQAAGGQQPAPPKPAAQEAGKTPPGQTRPAPKAEKAWTLKVSKSQPATISLHAKEAPLTEVAAELSAKLKIPFMLSPVMRRQKLTQDFDDMPLEGALRVLAPVPMVDYELGGDPAGQPKPLGVYLYAYNEEPPARDVVVKGNQEAFLIEGDTEEGTEAYEKAKEREDNPLRVKVDRNLFSVRARKQPLTVVLFEISNKVDIPFEIKYESTELVDVDFNNYTMEQVVRSLSPNIRLFQRTNLSNYETTPLRLALMPPANSQPNAKQ